MQGWGGEGEVQEMFLRELELNSEKQLFRRQVGKAFQVKCEASKQQIRCKRQWEGKKERKTWGSRLRPAHGRLHVLH